MCALFPDVKKVDLVPTPTGYVREMLNDTPGVIGWGSNSGFQAVNLAVQFGVKAVLLAGFDMHAKNGVHFFGKHERPLHNPTEQTLQGWAACFDRAAGQLEGWGVRVINLSKDSALTAYPKMTFMEALQCCDS